MAFMNQPVRGSELSAAIIFVKAKDMIVMMPRLQERTSLIVGCAGKGVYCLYMSEGTKKK